MYRLHLLALGISCAVLSCKDDPSGSPEIRAFEIVASSANVLRAEVRIRFSEKTTYRIAYWPTGDETATRTTEPYESSAKASATLIFLRPDTEYSCRILHGGESSEMKTFATRSLPANFPKHDLLVDKEMPEEPSGHILAYTRHSPGGLVYLMDARGRMVWYETVDEGVLVANMDPKTKRIYMLTGLISELYAYSGRYVKVIDLLGNELFSKDLFSVPELSGRQMHHECRPLSDGSALLVSYVEREFDLRARGGGEREIVRGDGYVVMDMQGNIAQMWDCYGHIDPRDDPHIMANKNSWLHANSINYDSEGNFYMTFRNLSQLWKIDPSTGAVKYRVGKNGTVALPNAGIPDGLHCANRALVYKVDPAGQTAEVTINSELPIEYSSALMSNVQKINDDMLLFGSGSARMIIFADTASRANILRVLSAPQQFYRAEYIPSLMDN